jgi:hypothetical protein
MIEDEALRAAGLAYDRTHSHEMAIRNEAVIDLSIDEKDIVNRLVASLRRRRFNYQNEKDLQSAIETVMVSDGFAFDREHDLGDAGCVDFFVSGFLGVEIKIKGSPSEVARQLLRYAGRDEVKGLLLVTGRAALASLPQVLLGKPIHLVELWRTFL